MECITIQNDDKFSPETSRFSYIRRITRKFSEARECELPTAAEARSYEEAIAHLVRVFPNKGDRDSSISPFRGSQPERKGLKLKACSSKGSRKECLKEIWNALRWMERKRLYDPPADDEIRFYLLLKKYMRSMVTFFSARLSFTSYPYSDLHDDLECLSYYSLLHHADELVELNRYLADFSVFLSEMDIENGSAIKPLMGIPDNYEAPPLIHGSKERSNIFYRHKFRLASLDIRSSEFAFSSPFAEEKRCYLQVLDHIESHSHSSVKTEDEMNAYSEELYLLFLEKIGRETSDLARHCTHIKSSILDKLSLSWESVVECFKDDPNEDPVIFKSRMLAEVYDPDTISVELSRKLADKCQVLNENLPSYITCVERCRDIAESMSLIVNSRLGTNGSDLLTNLIGVFGWEALHTLTLLKCGSFSSGNVFREHIILRNPQKNELEREAKMELKRCVQGGENENLKVLRGIVEDLRCIGDSDLLPDKEENALMHRIWLSVASSVHFFFAAMAYEQERYVKQRSSLLDVRKIGARATKRMMKNCTAATESTDLCDKKALEVRDLLYSADAEMKILSGVLCAFGRGLHEKLINSFDA